MRSRGDLVRSVRSDAPLQRGIRQKVYGICGGSLRTGGIHFERPRSVEAVVALTHARPDTTEQRVISPVRRFRIVVHKFFQISRNRSLQFGSRLVQSPQASLERYRIVAFLVSLSHFLFFALLESTEVVLDEESRVELAHRYLVVDSGRRYNLVQEFGTGSLPDLLNYGSKLRVRVVDISFRLDSQRRPYHGEEGRVE